VEVPRTAAEGVQARAVDDRVQPRAEGAAALEARQRAERADVGVLQRVVHGVRVAEQPVGQGPQLAVVGRDRLQERLDVAASGPRHQGLVTAREVHALAVPAGAHTGWTPEAAGPFDERGVRLGHAHSTRRTSGSFTTRAERVPNRARHVTGHRG
jgi:hypothetical protein